jgi:hypothetical protein
LLADNPWLSGATTTWLRSAGDAAASVSFGAGCGHHWRPLGLQLTQGLRLTIGN